MPVTRSIGRKTASATPQQSSTEATSGTTTEVTATTGTATEYTGTTTQQTAAQSSTPTVRTAPQEQAEAPEERQIQKSRPSSTKTKSPSKARRLAIARAELARLKIELATARIAEIEAESESDDGDSNSAVTEAEQEQRVHNWLHTSQLLAIEDQPHESNEPQPPTDPIVHGVTAAPRDMSAPAPAGVTAAHPPAFTAEPQEHRTTHPEANTATEPPPVITAWYKEHPATEPPQPANTQWQPNFEAAPPHEPTPNQHGTEIEQGNRNQLRELASAISEAVQAAQHRQIPRYTELPIFNGHHQDWLTFRAAYIETAHHFSTMENMSRLRRSLKGIAKEAVQGLLITNAEPTQVIKTLETRFGRPESIAMAELERLRTLPRLTESPRELCTFATKVENVIGTLQALDCVYYLYNPEVTKNITEKLTPTLKRQWYEFAATPPRGEPDLLKFSRFIRREAEICSPFAPPEIIHVDKPKDKAEQRRQRVHTVAEEPDCRLCKKQGHKIAECERFMGKSTEARWDLAKKFKLCFKCLRFRSNKHTCKPQKCDVDDCPHYHHKLLHAKRKEVKEPEEEQKVNSVWTSRVSYLKMIPISVFGPAGVVETHALLDDGSTITLIDDALAKKIGADGPKTPLHVSTYQGGTNTDETSRRVEITIAGTNRQRNKIEARTFTNLKLATQTIPKKIFERCKHLRNIESLRRNHEARPKILIGQDNWHLLLTTETRTGTREQPVASLTPLGWVIHGGHTRTLGQSINFISHVTEDEELHETVRQFITMDNMYIEPRKPSNDLGEKALRILQEHTRQEPDGRYETALLWRSEDATLPNNYKNTLHRLHNTERALDKNPEFKRKYTEQMEALVKKGYAELAPPTELTGRLWYLPHFAVLNPMKPGKIRVVHDAAARTQGTSLNDKLLSGPDLLRPLPGVIMKFRQHSIAVTADITEMFLQIRLREEDRNALRYLWRGDRRDAHPPEQYRMRTLIFGASSSPATAIYVMNANAEKYRDKYPDAVEAIQGKHYMDDYLDSFENLERAIKITSEVRHIQDQAHLKMNKWTSNSSELMEALGNSTERELTVDLRDDSKTERVLGLIWRPTEDTLAFNTQMTRVPPEVLQENAPTKRQALKIVMSLFDPLGLVSPVTIVAKQILQEVWRRGTGWDQKLEPDLSATWIKWMSHLESLTAISIPRNYIGYSTATSLQLHVFVDASETAYATVLYWRTVDQCGRVDVSLVTAKAKVAPLKTTSIPRLELQAATLGARIAAAVKQEHDRKPETTTYWTDSRTTLAWIRTGSRSFKPYVAHRIAAIEEHSQVSEWRWVPTKLNVADDATRNVPDAFNADHRWFTGPTFLRGTPETWPTETTVSIANTGEEKCHVIVTTSARLREALPDVERFSKWTRYLRATARTLQAIEKFKTTREKVNYKRNSSKPRPDPNWRHHSDKTQKPIRKTPVVTQDTLPLIPAATLHQALSLILRASQEDSFTEEIKALQNGSPISRDSRLHKLCVTLDGDMIQLRSRIGAAEGVSEELKNPTVLDGDHPATKLWINYIHERLHHAGVETVVNECRQHYWIVRIRPTTKSIVKGCLKCRLRTVNPPQPRTGDLPSCRLAHHRRPFTYTGLDYFGPLTITSGRTRQKRYVALFTCLTTRAVHLEIAQSLSADSAILALRRMIARRGCPTQIWSDNGTNFHGAAKELNDNMFKTTEHEATKRGIEWRFIPPGAPFMGGAWERMVRSIKIALEAVLNEKYPTEEVLHTLLLEAEHSVNSRPLTHVSMNPEDPEALTPNHFLLGGSDIVITPGRFEETSKDLRGSWRTSQRLADAFWSRWLREYLPELRNRRDPHGKGPQLRVGDLVLIVDHNLPRNVWPRGRIQAVHPGPDGVTRAVDVRTKGGVLRRPTKKLVKIPVAEPAPQESA